MPFGKWGTVREAATFYGISRQAIHKAIHKGGFLASKRVTLPRGVVWLIPYPFERRELRSGRPPEWAGKENGGNEAIRGTGR